MGLTIQSRSTVKFRAITTLVALFALTVQPMYGLVASQVANAAAFDECVGSSSACGSISNYPTIQGAIDDASPGNTIKVTAGTYNENVKIDKSLSLVGAGDGTSSQDTVINGQNTPGNKGAMYVVNANGNVVNNVNVSGFRVVQGGAKSAAFNVETGNGDPNDNINANHNVFVAASDGYAVYAGNLKNSNFANNVFETYGTNQPKILVYVLKTSSYNVNFTNNNFKGDMGDHLAFGSQASNSSFIGNNFGSKFSTSYAKIVDLTGHTAVASGNKFGNNQIAVNPNSSTFRGVYRQFSDDTNSGALDVAQTGDTLVAQPGTYDTFRVRNTDPDDLTIKASGADHQSVIETSVVNNKTLVDLKANGTTLEGFSINSHQTGGSAVITLDAKNLTVKDNVINGNPLNTSNNGIQTSNVPRTGNLVTGNTITAPRGISFQDGGTTFTKNKVTASHKAISVNTSGNTIEYNDFVGANSDVQAKANGIHLIVKNNWWGSTNGIQSTNTTKTGSSVDTTPWLCQPFEVSTTNHSDNDGNCQTMPKPVQVKPRDGHVFNYNDIKTSWYGIPRPTGANNQNQYEVRYGTDLGDLNQTTSRTTYSFKTLTGLTDGTYHWQVRAINGNQTSPWSNVRSFRVDTTSPQVDSVKAYFANGSTKSAPVYNDALHSVGYNPTSFEIDASDNDGSGIDYVRTIVYKQGNSGWNHLGSIDGSTVKLADHSNYFGTDGEYLFVIQAKDNVGNTTAHNVKVTFTVDNTKPTITARLDNTSISATDSNPTLTLVTNDTTSDIDHTEYKITDASGDKVQNWKTLSAGTTTDEVKVSTLGNGAYTLRARAYDKAGNKQSGADVSFTIDRSPAEVVQTTDPHQKPVHKSSGTLTPLPDTIGTLTVLSDGSANATGTGFGFNGQANGQAGATGDTAILGTQTEKGDKDNSDGNVLGESTAAISPSADGWKIFGLAWYWWLLILAAVAAAWYLIARALRNRRETPTI